MSIYADRKIALLEVRVMRLETELRDMGERLDALKLEANTASTLKAVSSAAHVPAPVLTKSGKPDGRSTRWLRRR